MCKTLFPDFQSFWFSCSKGANFYVFSVGISVKIWCPLKYFAFSHHFFHFAADFVTHSYHD